jgi:hypothetical protein
MLIQHFIRAFRTAFGGLAFGLAPAEARTIAFGLPGLLFALAALPETVQIDQVPHNIIPHKSKLENAIIPENGERCAKPKRALAGSIIIAGSPYQTQCGIQKNYLPLCATQYFGAVSQLGGTTTVQTISAFRRYDL